MDNMINVMDSLGESIQKSITEFNESKDLATRKQNAEIVKTLCESLGVFLNIANSPAFSNFEDEDMDFDDDEFDFEEDKHFHKKHKNKNKDN
jgi:hypothetical protein